MISFSSNGDSCKSVKYELNRPIYKQAYVDYHLYSVSMRHCRDRIVPLCLKMLHLVWMPYCEMLSRCRTAQMMVAATGWASNSRFTDTQLLNDVSRTSELRSIFVSECWCRGCKLDRDRRAPLGTSVRAAYTNARISKRIWCLSMMTRQRNRCGGDGEVYNFPCGGMCCNYWSDSRQKKKPKIMPRNKFVSCLSIVMSWYEGPSSVNRNRQVRASDLLLSSKLPDFVLQYLLLRSFLVAETASVENALCAQSNEYSYAS